MTKKLHRLTALIAAGAMTLTQFPDFALPISAVDDNSSLFEGFDIPDLSDPHEEPTEPASETPTETTEIEMPDFSSLTVEGLTPEQTQFAAEAIFRAIADPSVPETSKDGKLVRSIDLTGNDDELFLLVNDQEEKDVLKKGLSELFATIVYNCREGLLVKPFPDYYSGITTVADMTIVEDGVETTAKQEVYVFTGMSYSYLISPEQYVSEYEQTNTELDAILAQVDPEWSAPEKALFLHDYLSAYCNYDYAASKAYNDAVARWRNSEEAAWLKEVEEWEADGKNGDKPVCPPSPDAFSFACFTARDMLHNHLGVCHAYAWLYNVLMNECGVETYFIQSDKMNHSWNLLRIGEDWYHVDLTWDDQDMTRTQSGIQIKHDPADEHYKNETGDWLIGYGNQVDHCRFLVSSAEMLRVNERNSNCYTYDNATGQIIYHTDWIMSTGVNAYTLATSEAMTEGGFWGNALSAVCPFDGGWVIKSYYDMNGFKIDNDGYTVNYLLFTYDADTNTSHCIRQVASEGHEEDPWYRYRWLGSDYRMTLASNNYSVICKDGSDVLYYTTRGGLELHFVVRKPNADDYEINTLLNAEDYGFQESGYILGMYIDGDVMRFQLSFTPFEPPVEKTLPLETIHELLRNRTSYAPFAPETPSTMPSTEAPVLPTETTPASTDATEAVTTATEAVSTAAAETTTTVAATAAATEQTTTVTTTETVTEEPMTEPAETAEETRIHPTASEGYLVDGGTVQVSDIIRMTGYLNGTKHIISRSVRQRMDLDGNELIDIFDLGLLKWRLLNEQ